MIGTYLVHGWRHLLVVLLTHGLWMILVYYKKHILILVMIMSCCVMLD
jgi:hypothetical protein